MAKPENKGLRDMALAGQEYDVMFKGMDADEDGQVNEDEWADYYATRWNALHPKGRGCCGKGGGGGGCAIS